MAIKIGNKSEEGVYKLYKGIAALNVVAVNPNKAQLEKITGRSVDEEPVYLGKDDEGNDTERLLLELRLIMTLILMLTLVLFSQKLQE